MKAESATLLIAACDEMKGRPEKDAPRQGSAIGKLVGKIWKNSPSWIRFLFMVTFFRRNDYAHLHGLKDRYRT